MLCRKPPIQWGWPGLQTALESSLLNQEVSCFEEARQLLLQALDPIISPSLSELLGEDFQAEGQGEGGLWSPQTTRGFGEQRVNLTAPGTGSDRRFGELCPWLLLRVMLLFSVFLSPPNLLTCSVTMQSWEPFVNYFLLWFPWKTESHMHNLPRDGRHASGLTIPLPLTNEAKEKNHQHANQGFQVHLLKCPKASVF